MVSVHPTPPLDPVLPITHCALAIIGGHFLDVEKSEKSECEMTIERKTTFIGFGPPDYGAIIGVFVM